MANVMCRSLRHSLQLTLVLTAVFSVLQSSLAAVVQQKRAMHPAFQNAGKQEGVKIWRIENFEPVPYPEKEYGKFYEGDSYIVLFTKEDKKTNTFSWDIHFWLGDKTSQDESGAAAILSVDLDDGLGGGPVQHREVQDHESQQFLSYFKSGVRYVPGGVASGFQHVDINAPGEKKLYKVKGKRNVRVAQVEPKASSINKGDCFLLDTGRDIFVYVGAKAKGSEKVKAIAAANQIRDQDHAGRGKVNIIDSTSSANEVSDFFTALGSGSASQVSDAPAKDDDQDFERNQDATVTLYKVSDASGQVSAVKVAQKPIAQNQLDTNDCFILDTVTSGIYVWIGKKGTTQEKVEAMKNAQSFLKDKKYPSWTSIHRVVEGAEPSAFKNYFNTWTDNVRRGSSGSPRSSSRRARSVAISCGPAVGFMPDEGAGDMEIFRVENFELVPVDPNTNGKFFGGDSYVIKYRYEVGGREKYIIYYWQGATSTQDEKSASAIHALRLDNELGGKAIQIRVTQGNEPTHFLKLFKGNMIVFMGGKASGFRNLRDHDTYDLDGTRLFQIRGTCSDNSRAVQVPEVAQSLDSEFPYILETPKATYLWFGKECPSELLDLAEAMTSVVSPDTSVTTVSEGEEPAEFWTALNGQGEYTTSGTEKHYRTPKLFHCYLPDDSNKLLVEEIPHFSQEDLYEDDVMILDAGNVIYIWIGDQASQEEKKLSLKVAEKYLNDDNTDRSADDTLIISLKQGEEPESFTELFPQWDANFWLVK